MTDKQELYTIMTDEEYDALSEKYDEAIKKTERHVFELLNSALSRAEEDPDFWKFDNRGSL